LKNFELSTEENANTIDGILNQLAVRVNTYGGIDSRELSALQNDTCYNDVSM